jgi:hypothetical protein
MGEAFRIRAPMARSPEAKKYVAERARIDVRHAVRTMTTLPAAVFGLKDRGQLRAGAFADILIFDLSKVNDAATYEKPHQLSEGIDDIIVNGELRGAMERLRLRLPPRAAAGTKVINSLSRLGISHFTPSTQISYSNTIPALQLWLILRFA